jgi:hypothetical protein
MDELACFAPGMLALGASGYGPEKSEQIMNLAKEVNPLGGYSFLCSRFQVFAWNLNDDYILFYMFTDLISSLLSVHVIAC